jgi:Arc/MetJ-type ribon-helix-helix transcriptional regulator
MVRVTFSLSEDTVSEIRRTAARLRKPQSHVVRDAVAEYAAKSNRLSDAERHQALATIERLRATRPTRSAAETDDELSMVRAARRAGGRRSPPA